MASRHRNAPRSRRESVDLSSPAKADHHTAQLCRQVFKVLTYLFPGGLADPVLQDLMVESVTPGPDASRLQVLLRHTSPNNIPIWETLEHLDRAAPLMRREVAQGISRKRVPELAFIVLPAQEVAR